MLPFRILSSREVAVAAAAGLLLGFGTSCAPSSAATAKNQAGTAAASSGASPGQQEGGDGSRSAAGLGQPSERFVTRAKVDDDDAPSGGAPSLGQELIAHAVPATGDNAPPGQTTGRTSEDGGGNGVPVASAERRVGVVRVIGAHGKFVLLETTSGLGGVPLDEGQVLHCRGSAANGGVQTAMLKVSRERQVPYLVADVVSGEPQTGDVAYFPLKKEKEAAANARRGKKDQ